MKLGKLVPSARKALYFIGVQIPKVSFQSLNCIISGIGGGKLILKKYSEFIVAGTSYVVRH